MITVPVYTKLRQLFQNKSLGQTQIKLLTVKLLTENREETQSITIVPSMRRKNDDKHATVKKSVIRAKINHNKRYSE